MLAMVVDIASRVVTARDTRAGAWTLGSRKILDTLDSNAWLNMDPRSTRNTVSTDWVEVNTENT